ncbi:MAG: methyltransferase domain-containing protein [Verrucomicrobiales bacterium]|nr:methyltransferase domain-containing protein [Verrucomicrobiales bacterium]
METVRFLKEFLRNRHTMGAVAPSSPHLAERMMEVAEVWKADRVVELGPGLGALTGAIFDVLPRQSDYLGVDLNEDFVVKLRERFPGRRFEAGAAELFDFGAVWPDGDGYDAVISGLPWTMFPESLQVKILDRVLEGLRKGGRFATFAYWGFHWMPKGKRFRELLHERLPGVESSRVVLNNMPPAFVYVARR